MKKASKSNENNHPIPIGYLYRIRNKVNGKSYVGRRNLCYDKSWRHYMGSGQLIKNAIIFYGEENFTKEFLGYYFDSKSLSEAEEALIKSEWATGHCEYNIGLTPDPDTIRKMSEEKLVERSRKLSEAMKTYHASNPNANTFSNRAQKFKEDYNSFKENHQEEILKAFDSEPNAAKIIRDNNFSKTWVFRILKENDRKLQARNVKGHVTSEETRKKQTRTNIINIINSHPETYPVTNTIDENIELYHRTKTRTCAYKDCSKEFIFHRENQEYCSRECGFMGRNAANFLTREQLEQFYLVEGHSISHIAQKYNLRWDVVRNRLKNLEIIKK